MAEKHANSQELLGGAVSRESWQGLENETESII